MGKMAVENGKRPIRQYFVIMKSLDPVAWNIGLVGPKAGNTSLKFAFAWRSVSREMLATGEIAGRLAILLSLPAFMLSDRVSRDREFRRIVTKTITSIYGVAARLANRWDQPTSQNAKV